MKLKKVFSQIIFTCFMIAIPLSSKAAVLYIDPPAGQFAPGDTIIAKVKIDNQGECINAADLAIKFSDNLRAVDFSSGNSVINIWINQPGTSDMKKINLDKLMPFSGGVPGGYCGPVQGDQGETNILAEAVFTVVDTGQSTAELSVADNPQLLKNDGSGSPVAVESKNAAYTIVSTSSIEKSEWSKRLEEDDIPPESFTVELQKDDRVYEGKYYIIFSSTDKQTGIDHYEVMEQKVSAEDGGKFLKGLVRQKPAQWKTGQSPYLLDDQTLNSDIYVKAVDKVGNEKTVKYSAKTPGGIKKNVGFLKGGIMVILSILAVTILVFAVFKTTKLFKRLK